MLQRPPEENDSPTDRPWRVPSAEAPFEPAIDSAFDPDLPLPDAERHGVGLCLSGTGFRAAIFHLGALRRLDELQVLGRLWTVSSTSGGSIAAAHLVTRVAWPISERMADWSDYVASPLRELARTNLAPRPGRPIRPEAENDRLTREFERGLTRFMIRDLPSLPTFIFSGADPTEPSLARAVASTIVDFTGDHLAVEPVWRDHRTLLVADGGGVFGRTHPIEREARALGRRWLLSSFKTGLLKGAYWSIESARSSYDSRDLLGYSKSFAKTVLSSIGHGLEGLSMREANILENHGYLVADSAIETHAPELVTRPAPPLAIPHPKWMDESFASRD